MKRFFKSACVVERDGGFFVVVHKAFGGLLFFKKTFLTQLIFQKKSGSLKSEN